MDESDFDPYSAFEDHMGEWVFIGHERFFRPYVIGSGWQPYQNGYWSYDIDFGWTWVSYDPWGFVTDHYGVWRHHGLHGWIWLPFPVGHRHYRPHCVTWFDDDSHGDYVGWYPYYADYPGGYRHGYDDGFNDGFWMGFQAAQQIPKGPSFFLGITVVKRVDVTVVNVFEHRVREDFAINIAVNAHNRKRVRGDIPGGNREKAYGFLQVSSDKDRLAPTGRLRRDKLENGGSIMRAPEDDRRERVKLLKEQRRKMDRPDSSERRHKKHDKTVTAPDRRDNDTVAPPASSKRKHRKFADPQIETSDDIRPRHDTREPKRRAVEAQVENPAILDEPTLEEPKVQIKPRPDTDSRPTKKKRTKIERTDDNNNRVTVVTDDPDSVSIQVGPEDERRHSKDPALSEEARDRDHKDKSKKRKKKNRESEAAVEP